MQNSIALGAQIPAVMALEHGQRFSVVVVHAFCPAGTSVQEHGRGEELGVIRMKGAEGGKREPEFWRVEALGCSPTLSLYSG